MHHFVQYSFTDLWGINCGAPLDVACLDSSPLEVRIKRARGLRNSDVVPGTGHECREKSLTFLADLWGMVGFIGNIGWFLIGLLKFIPPINVINQPFHLVVDRPI